MPCLAITRRGRSRLFEHDDWAIFSDVAESRKTQGGKRLLASPRSYYGPKEGRAFMRILSTEGRGVGPCKDLSQSKGPAGVPRPSENTHPPRTPLGP